MRKVKQQLLQNRPSDLAFGSQARRDQYHFHALLAKNRAYQGKAGQYHREAPFVKPTANALL